MGHQLLLMSNPVQQGTPTYSPPPAKANTGQHSASAPRPSQHVQAGDSPAPASAPATGDGRASPQFGVPKIASTLPMPISANTGNGAMSNSSLPQARRGLSNALIGLGAAEKHPGQKSKMPSDGLRPNSASPDMDSDGTSFGSSISNSYDSKASLGTSGQPAASRDESEAVGHPDYVPATQPEVEEDTKTSAKPVPKAASYALVAAAMHQQGADAQSSAAAPASASFNGLVPFMEYKRPAMQRINSTRLPRPSMRRAVHLRNISKMGGFPRDLRFPITAKKQTEIALKCLKQLLQRLPIPTRTHPAKGRLAG